MQNKKAIPVQTLSLDVNENKHIVSNQGQKIVVASGGFKIPQSVIDEKKKMFSGEQKQQQLPIQDMQLSQLEIFSKMGLKPYKMQNAIGDKEEIVFNNIKDQPLAHSNFIQEQKRIVQIESKDIDQRMKQFLIDDDDDLQENDGRMEQVQQDIDKHYERLQKLEQQFMMNDVGDSYVPDENVWEKIKQLRDYRKNIKQEQLQAREEYEERRRKDQNKIKVQIIEKPTHQERQQKKQKEKDEFMKQQMDEFMKQKELNKNRARSKEKYMENIPAKAPEQQIYEHQFLEYQKDKQLKKQLEEKAKEFEQPEFQRYHLKENFEKKPKQNVGITDRAILQVNTIEELHKVQIQAYNEKQLEQLDPANKKAIYKSIVQDKQQEKLQENDKNEQFVLKFSFQQIDKDCANVVSKGEVLEFLCYNKDIQIIFDLDPKIIEPELDKFQTHRKGLFDFQEFSNFVKKLQHDRNQLIKKLKQDSKLFEEDQEERIKMIYFQPIKEIFKILDYQQIGVVNRLDFIRAIRNDISKKSPHILNQSISLQQGSPSVNQILEKVIADYRIAKNRKEIEMISLQQFEQYFQQSLPYEEIRLMQARIILAHFGPGSMASEGYYQKIKGRCLLEHNTIQQLLEIFMKLDTDCELIINKKNLIDEIRLQIDCEQEAAILPKIGKKYTLSKILDVIETTLINQVGHAQNFISLQQFTDYLTNFNPIPPKIPTLYFINEQQNPPQDEYLVMQISSVYLQILNDIFDMIPAVCAHFILKEEFIATVKNDPQSRSLLSQIAKFDPITKKPESINSIISKITKLDIDFIQWADIVYMFSDKGDILQEDYQNKLEIKPQQRRGRKIYEEIIKGQDIEDHDEHVEIENLSFDLAQQQRIQSLPPSKMNGDLKQIQLNTNLNQNKLHSSSLNRITVPKEPKFHSRNKKTIRQQKLEEMVKEIEEKEEFELNNKFKANPIPLSMFVPAHNLDKYSSVKIQNANPPSFYQKDVQKFMERKQIAEERIQTKEKPKTFKAKEIPIECTIEVLKQKEISEQQRKKEVKEKRIAELKTNSQMPKRLQEDEEKRKEKKKKIAELNPQDLDPECKFNPKINKNFISKRDKDKKSTIKGQDIFYLDDDNQRNKRSASNHEEDQQLNKNEKLEKTNSKNHSLQQQSEQSQTIKTLEKSVNQIQNDEKLSNFKNKEENQIKDVNDQEDYEGQFEEINQEDQELNNQEEQDNQIKENDQQNNYQENQQEISENQQQDQKEQSQKKEIQKQDPIVKQEKKPKGKILSSQDREIQRIEEEKQKQKNQKKEQKNKLNSGYRQKIEEMENRVYQRPLVSNTKQHGSSTLQKYRQMAQEASLKKDIKGEENNQQDDELEKEQE